MKVLAVFCLVMFLCPSIGLAGEMETLLGFSTDFDTGTITIDVVGSGCTDKSSFRMDLTNNILTVFRVRRDTCKAMPEKIPFTYTVNEVGINPHKPFSIANPFLVNENLAGILEIPETRYDSLPTPVSRNE
ncbi:MAG: hypothetical protein PHD01_02820 [Geobacteraceae bacterium]|nr:hypothetical protein [Geobacteraceae bacterium]